MQRLTAGDASFLYMENPVVHMHVTGVMFFDPSSAPGGYTFEKSRALIIDRLHLIEPFRRRLVEVPLGIDHPVWVEDPDFDLDRHLHRQVFDPPIDAQAFADFVGEYASVKLDRSRPLWDMVICEGLADGSIALVSKMHHAAVDGITGADMMAHLLDFTPDAGPPPPATTEWAPGEVPGPAQVALDAAVNRVRTPLRTVQALGRMGSSLVGLGRSAIAGRTSGGPTMARPFNAPRTLVNSSLTGRRSVAMGKARLEDLKEIKTVFGTTVNDVFLAACTQSLRSYLAARDDLPDQPLVCSVPVSVHGKSADTSTTNQVSNMFVHLPVDVEDPVEQLLRVRADTRDAKIAHDAIGADMIGDVTELTPPGLFNLASRMYSRAGLADRLPPVQNVVISNVPGPPIPLYTAGMRLTGVFPFGPLMEGAGLNITVLSNMGNMDIGVIGCPDTVPDINHVRDGIVDGIATLLAAARAEADARAERAERVLAQEEEAARKRKAPTRRKKKS